MKVTFMGGQMKDGVHYGDYMICTAIGADGDEVELYAEAYAPDEFQGKEVTQGELDKFDAEAYKTLKAEIISQAKEAGVDPDILEFQ